MYIDTTLHTTYVHIPIVGPLTGTALLYYWHPKLEFCDFFFSQQLRFGRQLKLTQRMLASVASYISKFNSPIISHLSDINGVNALYSANACTTKHMSALVK